jgi:hypothetical protein
MTMDPKTSERLGRIITEPDTQTRISLFLISIKQANAALLSHVEFQPMVWESFSLLHNQFCREIEIIGLLQRVTTWSMNPAVYFKAMSSGPRYLGDLQFAQFAMKPFGMDTSFYRYLALTHALYAHLRFTPLLPLDMPIEHPYLAFLRSLETIHGRQMQAQIALLRKLPVPLSDEEKERIVGEEGRKVREVFRCFVEEITI